MGHYRSEMGYEDEDRKAEERRAVRHKRTMEFIQAEIDRRGVAAVLADLALEGETSFSIRYRK